MTQLFEDHAIIFYDGDCLLCHGFIAWVLRHDSLDLFYVAPLQGQTFKSYLKRESMTSPKVDSVFVLTKHENRLLSKSDAVLYCLIGLGGKWKLIAQMTSFIPKILRDFIYTIVAFFRKKIGGRSQELCPILPKELRAKVLN